MKIGFDSNVWEKVVSDKSDPYQSIKQKILAGDLQPYICEVAVLLESIEKKHRLGFFRSYTPIIEFVDSPSQGSNIIRQQVHFRPNIEAHPVLPGILVQRLHEAKKIGFKVIHMNRFGTVRTNQIPKDMYVTVGTKAEFWEQAERFSDCVKFIYALRAGQYQYDQLKKSYALECGSVLRLASKIPVEETKKFSKAIAEWADGDSIAGCYSIGVNYFCTDDGGKGAGRSSVFSADNIAKVTERFCINVISSAAAAL